MAPKFLMSEQNLQVSSLMKAFGHEEASAFEIPDYIIFTGGADVSPSLYFEKPHLLTRTDQSRDYQDFCSVIAARLRGVPMLGICRGMQLLHVAGGGTLLQHITGHGGVTHALRNKDDSPIKGWETLFVNSTHHQCVPVEETSDYDVVYCSHQGTTEVIVSEKKGFVAVQFHPEYPNASDESVAFFEELVKTKLGGMM